MQEKEKYPLVSAICILNHTNSDKLANLICAFQNQTYPNKELIIVNNNESQYLNSQVSIAAESDIFLIDTPMRVNAGMARNYGISAANGTILAQFDDIYYHHSNRIEAQVAAIAQNDSHMSLLNSCLSYSFISGRLSLYQNMKNIVLGSAVYIRPSQIDYPDIDKLEEKEFIERYIGGGYKVVSMNQPELLCKMIGDNYINDVEFSSELDEKYVTHVRSLLKYYS